MQVEAEGGESLQVAGQRRERRRIVEGQVNVQLKADAVEGNAAGFEVLGHGIDGVGFGVERLGIVIVVEKLGVGVGVARPREYWLDLLSPHPGEADPGLPLSYV